MSTETVVNPDMEKTLGFIKEALHVGVREAFTKMNTREVKEFIETPVEMEFEDKEGWDGN